jgi:hypothetical protein
MANEVAVGKRLAIKKINKQMFAMVLISASAFAVIVIASIWLTKTIMFNVRIIETQDETLTLYSANNKAIQSLNDKVMGLSDNASLESVARERDLSCLSATGELADFSKDVAAMRTCSALRVVPDAMPSRKNATALMASLKELATYPGVVLETDNVSDSSSKGSGKGVNVITSSYSVVGAPNAIKGLLSQFERSIRPFDTLTATIDWRVGGNISLSVHSNSFYLNASQMETINDVKHKNVTMEEKKR